MECETCTPIGYLDTWRCSECGAMNINKWTECWKCGTPRLKEAVPESGKEKTGPASAEARPGRNVRSK
jgi:ribosomal protein L40E